MEIFLRMDGVSGVGVDAVLASLRGKYSEQIVRFAQSRVFLSIFGGTRCEVFSLYVLVSKFMFLP